MRETDSIVLLTGVACLLGLAGGARAGVTIDVVFQDATSPSGIAILPGDTGPGCAFGGYAGGSVSSGYCLDVILTTTWGFNQMSASVAYDGDNGLAVAQIYEAGAVYPPTFPKTYLPCRPVDGVADNGGIIEHFDCTSPDPWYVPSGTYRIGTIIWDTSATTPGTELIQAIFGAGDGVTALINGNAVDVSSSVVLGSHFLTIVPEPGSAALLGLSLVALTIAARRRRPLAP